MGCGPSESQKVDKAKNSEAPIQKVDEPANDNQDVVKENSQKKKPSENLHNDNSVEDEKKVINNDNKPEQVNESKSEPSLIIKEKNFEDLNKEENKNNSKQEIGENHEDSALNKSAHSSKKNPNDSQNKESKNEPGASVYPLEQPNDQQETPFMGNLQEDNMNEESPSQVIPGQTPKLNEADDINGNNNPPIEEEPNKDEVPVGNIENPAGNKEGLDNAEGNNDGNENGSIVDKENINENLNGAAVNNEGSEEYKEDSMIVQERENKDQPENPGEQNPTESNLKSSYLAKRSHYNEKYLLSFTKSPELSNNVSLVKDKYHPPEEFNEEDLEPRVKAFYKFAGELHTKFDSLVDDYRWELYDKGENWEGQQRTNGT